MSRMDDHVFLPHELRRRNPRFVRRLPQQNTSLDTVAPHAMAMVPLAAAMSTAAYCLSYALTMLVSPHLQGQQQTPLMSLRGLAHFGFVALFSLGAASLFTQRRRLYRAYEKQWLITERPGLYRDQQQHVLARQQRCYQIASLVAFGALAIAHCGVSERLIEATPLLMQLGLMVGMMALSTLWVNDMQDISWKHAPARAVLH